VSKLIFKGPAIVIDEESEVTDIEKIKSLDGLKCDGEDSLFSEYMSDGGDDTLENAGISGGVMYFKFDTVSNSLFGYVEYDLVRPLTSDELDELKDYTIGQLTDGIGSGFEQERAMSELIFPVINYEKLSVEYS